MTTTTNTTPDRIEKTTVLRAPQKRVWNALTDASQFATWFGCTLNETFAPGRKITGEIRMKGQVFKIEFTIDRLEPEDYFSYRWHPYAIDPNKDYSSEPATLVEFHLKTVPEGTELTVIESGFDRVPEHRRAEAYRMNSGGWNAQVENIRRYVES
jgi:uncharacterized protein YndB with AHSA1/START domain